MYSVYAHIFMPLVYFHNTVLSIVLVSLCRANRDVYFVLDLSSMKTKLKTEVKSEPTTEPSGDTNKKSPSSDKSDGPGDAEVKVKTEPGAATTQTPKEAKDAGKKTSSAAGEQRRLGISEAVRAEMERIVAENRRIQDLATTVHQKNHEIMLKVQTRFFLLFQITVLHSLYDVYFLIMFTW